jgi:RHS repeat-associated protein
MTATKTDIRLFFAVIIVQNEHYTDIFACGSVQMYDTDSGLYYLQSRYYDPVTGRFLNADDPIVLSLSQGNLLGTNLFAYCDNNPVMFSDSSGKIPVWILYAAAGAILFGGVTYLIGRILGISGWTLAALTGSLAALGAAAAAIFGLKFLSKVAPKLAAWFNKVAKGTKVLPPNISKDKQRKLSLGGIVILDAFKIMFHPPGGKHNFFHIQIEAKIPGIGRRWTVLGRIKINPKNWFK